MIKQVFTCSFCFCSAFDLKIAGVEAVEQVCSNVSIAMSCSLGEEQGVRPWHTLSWHCSPGYSNLNFHFEMRINFFGPHSCKVIALLWKDFANRLDACRRWLSCSCSTWKTGWWLHRLKQSIRLDTSRAQVLPGAWRLRGGCCMKHNPHPSTAALSLTFAGHCQPQRFAQAKPVVFSARADEGRCGQTSLSHTTPAVAHSNATWGLITDPGAQNILWDAAGGRSLRSPDGQACCRLTTAGAAQTAPSSFPAHPAELGSALTRAVSAQFPSPFTSERLWVLLNRKGLGLLFWSQTELHFWPLGKRLFFFSLVNRDNTGNLMRPWFTLVQSRTEI